MATTSAAPKPPPRHARTIRAIGARPATYPGIREDMSACADRHAAIGAPGDCHDGQVTSPTRLILIRHGESRSVAEGWLSGRETCGGLTDMGRDQAEQFRRRAAADPDLVPDVVIASTMRRALETAEVITSGLGIVVDRVDHGGCGQTSRADGVDRLSRWRDHGDSELADGVSDLTPRTAMGQPATDRAVGMGAGGRAMGIAPVQRLRPPHVGARRADGWWRRSSRSANAPDLIWFCLKGGRSLDRGRSRPPR
jgi:hypothetical protein